MRDCDCQADGGLPPAPRWDQSDSDPAKIDLSGDDCDGESREAYREKVEAYRDLVTYARSAREDAEACIASLDGAAAAYLRGDIQAVLGALDDANNIELQYGATPATDDLRQKLINTCAAQITAGK